MATAIKSGSRLLLPVLALAVGHNSTWAQPAASSDWKHLQSDGEAAMCGNNYGLAENNFLAALHEAEKLDVADLHVADSLQALASLYCIRGLFAKAQPLYERELRVREHVLGGEHPDVVCAVGKLAQFYLNH